MNLKIVYSVILIIICNHNFSFCLESSIECNENEHIPLTGECVYYQKCVNGQFKPTKCPTKFISHELYENRMFDPVSRKCIDKRKLEVSGKCNAYRECVLNKTISHVEKWREQLCESSFHFDEASQKCIESNKSTCDSKQCTNDTCLNGGQCEESSNSAYKCFCPKGFSGKNCEDSNPCTNNFCMNDGICLSDRDGNMKCKCINGFNGNRCENRKFEVSCDFENHLCGYTARYGKFERYSGPSPSNTSGPEADHSGNGFYALCPGHKQISGMIPCELYQEIHINDEQMELNFWYYFYGMTTGSLSLKKDGKNIWSINENKNEWLQAKVVLPVGHYELSFSVSRAVTSETVSNDVAIDDIVLAKKSSPITPKSTTNTISDEQEISCNFDENYCEYETIEFERKKGESESLSSGPSSDHTTGESFYLLCKSGNPGKECELKKDINIQIVDRQFSFWYYMFGLKIGTLNLTVDGVEKWKKEGRQQKKWLHSGNITLPVGTYELKFSATVLGRLSSDIAIDDLYLEGQELATKLTTKIPSEIPSEIPDDSLKCDFDNGLCGWDTESDTIKWKNLDGDQSETYNSYGPGSDYTSTQTDDCSFPFERNSRDYYYCSSVDSTNYYDTKQCKRKDGREIACKKGKYAMITSENYLEKSDSFRSRLYSPICRAYFFSFYYNIFGATDDGFRILVENYKSKELKVLGSIRGPLSKDKWYYASVELNNIKFDIIRIVIEPFKGSYRGYSSISIDEVSVTNFETTSEPETTEESRKLIN